MVLGLPVLGGCLRAGAWLPASAAASCAVALAHRLPRGFPLVPPACGWSSGPCGGPGSLPPGLLLWLPPRAVVPRDVTRRRSSGGGGSCGRLAVPSGSWVGPCLIRSSSAHFSCCLFDLAPLKLLPSFTQCWLPLRVGLRCSP